MNDKPWFVVQIGAREHYAIARALHSRAKLETLITDNWHSSPPLFSKVIGQRYAKKMAGRCSDELSTANVIAFNQSSLRFEVGQRLQRNTGWELIRRRNDWFQRQVVEWLTPRLTPEHTVFAYSYAAREIFELCRKVGAYTILGQIDPGIYEEDVVDEEVARYAEIETGFKRAPAKYWEDWRAECELADVVIVNSQWSRDALAAADIPVNKIETVPLVYSPPDKTNDFKRDYPAALNDKRPLRVLYLGQVIPRKGIQHVIEAAEQLVDLPVEITVVGEPGPWQERLEQQPNIKVVGNVPRGEVDCYYRHADLFLFPTLSDGFGLTQLEAQYWRLPLICSRHCGQVVVDGKNGIELAEVSAESIATAIKRVLAQPSRLATWSDNSTPHQFTLQDLGEQLCRLSERVTL